MLKEVPLDSTKYLKDAVDRQYAEYTRIRNRNAVRSFILFLSTIACFFIGLMLAQQVPHWLPILGIGQ